MEKSLQNTENKLPIEDETLDPRVQEANNSFRASLNETSSQLQALSKKLGICVEKARPYYEAKEKAKQLQIECQRAAVQYQRANAVHQAARETISLAEDRFTNLRDGSTERKFDAAWQEMLNHATMKVMEAEAQKSASEREHQKRAAAYTAAEKEAQELQRKLKTVINKSRPYFNHRAATQIKLEAQKDQIQKLQKDVVLAKNKYSFTLRSLERISEEIHELRRINMKREPGVGAEMNPSDVFIEMPSKESTLNAKVVEEQKYWDNLKEKLHELKENEKIIGNENTSNKDASYLVFKDNLSIPYQELSKNTRDDDTRRPFVRYDNITSLDPKNIDNSLLPKVRPSIHNLESLNRTQVSDDLDKNYLKANFAEISGYAERISLSDILIEEKEDDVPHLRTDPSGQADELPFSSFEETSPEKFSLIENSQLDLKRTQELQSKENETINTENFMTKFKETDSQNLDSYTINKDLNLKKISGFEDDLPKPKTVADTVKKFESLATTCTTVLDNGNVLTGYESELL
ncbi:SH3 domain-binding protein 5-like protein [Armadillidium vulgare]|nr:SH3 domain-binding protein 5-like protein [Armadillidium vulgare]